MKLRFHVLVLMLLTTFGWPQTTVSPQPTTSLAAEPIICVSTPVLGRPVAEFTPAYPKRALKAGIQGDVILDLMVSKAGKVTSVSILSGNQELSREAVKAVQKWVYSPVQEQHAAERHTRITLIFKIDDVGKPVIGAEFPSSARFCNGDESVAAPRPIYTPDPSYSEDARKAKREGVSVLSVVVGRDGLPQEVIVKRALGYGLDEKATEAVQHWRFEPARRNGTPVAVKINIEVQFHYF